MEIIRNRTIRPSSRLATSKNYKIDTKVVTRSDTLIVNIDHEAKPFRGTYRFNGRHLAEIDSISFRPIENGTSIDIRWSGAQPIEANSANSGIITLLAKNLKQKDSLGRPSGSKNLKTSFDPISGPDARVLILGSMPGDTSIELGEYYAHPGNRFWKTISTITGNALPQSYADKKALLLKSRMAIWDVAHKAVRKGSLDQNIRDEEPNDLNKFLNKHKNLRIVGFNGAKAQRLFEKYFDKREGITYIVLPSTSPANNGTSFESLCRVWKQILVS